MRILVLSHAPSVHTRRWVDALTARGHDLHVVSAEGAEGYGDRLTVAGHAAPIEALRYATMLGAVRAAHHRFRPDVTAAHFLPNYGFLAALAGVRPWLLTCWGSDLLVNARRTPLHRARARFTLARADLIHVDADNLADAAVSLGARPDRIWRRAWGVDVDGLRSSTPWSRRRAGSGPLRILWTRMLEPVYEPMGFVRGLLALRRKGLPFRATIAGEGSLLEDLIRRVRVEGLGDQIRFVGHVGFDRLRALLAEHDVYVSLSHSDSTSQSLLEAMAAGLVAVVSDIAGNREWVRHRVEGLLVPTDDAEAVACALAEIDARTEESDAMTGRAFARVEGGARFEETLDQLETRLGALAGKMKPVP